MSLWVMVCCCIHQISVEVVLFLYMLTSFLHYVAFQALIYEKVCLLEYNQMLCNNLRNETFKDEEKNVQKITSLWILYGNIALTVPSIITVTFIGSWGDNFSRKLPIILPCTGAVLSAICTLLNYVYADAPLSLLLIGPFINGLLGGFIAMMMSVYSYITHTLSTDFRTIRIAILEAMIFLAGTVGVFVSGVMLDSMGFVFVLSFIIGCLLLAMGYTIFWLKEVIVQEPQEFLEYCRNLSHLDHFRQFISCMTKRRETGKRGFIFLQAAILFIVTFCTTGEIDILLLYVKHTPLSWSLTLYGYFRGFESFMRGLLLLTLLPLLKTCFHFKETLLAFAGLMSKILGFIVLGFARSTWLVFMVPLISMLQGFTAAALRSLMSTMVATDEQGKLFAFVASVESLAMLFSSLFFNMLYPATLNVFAGASFIVAAGLCMLAVAFVFILHKLYKQDSPYFGLPTESLQDDQEAISSSGIYI